MLSQIANTISSPLVHVPLLFILCRLFVAFNWYRNTFKWLSCIPIVWLYICSLPYPSEVMIHSLETQYKVIPIESDEWKQTDAIVVLACYYYDDQALPFVSRWPNCSLQRNLHGALMYQTHPLPIYLAGGVLDESLNKSIAEYNQSFFEHISHGANSNEIFTVAEGSNTETEAAALAPLLKDKYISLVTSARHLPRAVTYFEDLGIKVLPIPVEHLATKKIQFKLGWPSARSLRKSEKAIHEYLGLIYQKFIR